MAVGRLVQDLQEFQFLGRLQGLVAQLDDVHAAGKGRVHEVRKVAAVLPGIGAKVEAGGGVDGILAHASSLVPLNWANTAGARRRHATSVRHRQAERASEPTA